MKGLATAQNIAFGIGIGFPLMPYVKNEPGWEFRTQPKVGYYPVLKDLRNTPGSAHFNLTFSIKPDFLPIFDSLDFRADFSTFAWDKAETRYVSCEPADKGSLSDSDTDYIPLSKQRCFDVSRYKSEKDISEEERSLLWFLQFGVGVTYRFFELYRWSVYSGAHVGAALSYYESANWGMGGDLVVGTSYRFSELIILELNTRLGGVLTSVPDKTQRRINHVVQTKGNVFDALMQPFASVDIQLALRFDLSEE